MNKLGISDEEFAVVLKVKKIVGYVPMGFRDVLHILAHPDCIDETKAYLDSKG